MVCQRVADALLPTPWGTFQMIGFATTSPANQEHLALVLGDLSSAEPMLVRIHSECLTGDALFSLRCDCGFQLQAALMRIAATGRGILLYHRQEGRGIGLLNKIRAYALQDQGADTVEANLHLGFAADERNFTTCANILELLGVESIRLLTNNPHKVALLTHAGIKVIERIPLQTEVTVHNQRYLHTKSSKLGHLLNDVLPTPP